MDPIKNKAWEDQLPYICFLLYIYRDRINFFADTIKLATTTFTYEGL